MIEVPNAAAPDPGSSSDPQGYAEVSPDADTTPMAVILGDRSLGEQPATPAKPDDVASSRKRMRGPFEPPEKSDPVDNGESSPVRTPEAGPADSADGATESDAERASVWSEAAAKMDQIKDLYLTAEAIGEDALDKHFALVSDRQRQLIREYFNQAVAGDAQSHDTAS